MFDGRQIPDVKIWNTTLFLELGLKKYVELSDCPLGLEKLVHTLKGHQKQAVLGLPHRNVGWDHGRASGSQSASLLRFSQ